MARRSWSIRVWLGSLVAAVAVPLLLLLIWLFVLQLQRELRDAREDALRIARATAQRVAAQHEGSTALLRQMAMRPSIRDFDGTSCDSLFPIVDFFPQWADLLLYDRAGRVVCSADPQGEDRTLSAAAQQWLARAGVPVNQPAVVLVQGRWMSILSAPVTAPDGAPRGTLVLLQRLGLRGEPLPPHSALAILDRRGAVLARIDDGPPNESRQYGSDTIPQLGWTVSVGLPTAAVMQPVRNTFILGVAGGAVILALIALVAVMFSRAIERPVGALVQARSESERNLKALSERLLVVQEQERMRVAREIHDDLGQSLTALKMDVIGLVEKTPPRPELQPMIDRIGLTLENAVTAVQRISSELRPSVLDDLGLYAAIELETQTFEERTGIECELSVPENPPPVEGAAATAVYRMVQEALTNVARHSNASRVELRARERGGNLLLEIRDDGRGITGDELSDPDSLGLLGIRERAEILGGTAHFEGVPGRGTIVSIRLPLAAAPAGSAP